MTGLIASCQVLLGQKATIFHLMPQIRSSKNYRRDHGETIIFVNLINSSFNDKQKKYKSEGYADPLFYRVDE
jgi:hypothetical protein